MVVRDYSAEGAATSAPASRFASGEYRNNTSGPVSGFVGFPSASAGGADIEAAKEAAHINASFAGNTFNGAVSQALSGGTLDYNVSVADVKALASKLSKGKKSLAVSGDLSNCPFVSEL